MDDLETLRTAHLEAQSRLDALKARCADECKGTDDPVAHAAHGADLAAAYAAFQAAGNAFARGLDETEIRARAAALGLTVQEG